jgi:hypothetical protein
MPEYNLGVGAYGISTTGIRNDTAGDAIHFQHDCTESLGEIVMRKMKESRRIAMLIGGLALIAVFLPAPANARWFAILGVALIVIALVGRTTIQELED